MALRMNSRVAAARDLEVSGGLLIRVGTPGVVVAVTRGSRGRSYTVVFAPSGGRAVKVAVGGWYAADLVEADVHAAQQAQARRL